MLKAITKWDFLSILLFDLLSVGIILMVPTFSHMAGFPFYIFEPMRIIVLSYLLFSGHKNAYFLAVILPLFSFLIAGHPTLFKFPLVSIDLIINVFFFILLSNKKINVFLNLAISIILSKVVYYVLKFLFIQFTLLNNGLVETNLEIQFLNIGILMLIALAFRKKIRKQDLGN